MCLGQMAGKLPPRGQAVFICHRVAAAAMSLPPSASLAGFGSSYPRSRLSLCHVLWCINSTWTPLRPGSHVSSISAWERDYVQPGMNSTVIITHAHLNLSSFIRNLGASKDMSAKPGKLLIKLETMMEWHKDLCNLLFIQSFTVNWVSGHQTQHQNTNISNPSPLCVLFA